MDEMDARTTLVAAGLDAGALGAGVMAGGFIAPPRLCLAAGAFLTPSETDARGRVAVAADFAEAVEVGETIERANTAGFGAVAAAGLPEVEEDSGLEIDEASVGLFGEEGVVLGAVGAAGLAGAIDARRIGPVTDGPVEGALVIWLIFVGEAGVFALTDFFNTLVAEAGFDVVAAPVADAAFVTGVAFAFPAPKVPELRIYVVYV